MSGVGPWHEVWSCTGKCWVRVDSELGWSPTRTQAQALALVGNRRDRHWWRVYRFEPGDVPPPKDGVPSVRLLLELLPLDGIPRSCRKGVYADPPGEPSGNLPRPGKVTLAVATERYERWLRGGRGEPAWLYSVVRRGPRLDPGPRQRVWYVADSSLAKTVIHPRIVKALGPNETALIDRRLVRVPTTDMFIQVPGRIRVRVVPWLQARAPEARGVDMVLGTDYLNAARMPG